MKKKIIFTIFDYSTYITIINKQSSAKSAKPYWKLDAIWGVIRSFSSFLDLSCFSEYQFEFEQVAVWGCYRETYLPIPQVSPGGLPTESWNLDWKFPRIS